MSDSKGLYSTNAAKARQVAIKSSALKQIKENSTIRKEMYQKNWAQVNLNEIVEKFSPKAEPYERGGKFIYGGERYDVVTDTFGGYLRIIDKTIPKTGRKENRYITLDGRSYLSLPKNQREELTHFYILKRKDM